MSICIALDIETTGTDTTKDRIVQLSMVKFSLPDFTIIEKKKTNINPTIPIQEGATKVHGITNDMVKDCITFKSFANALLKYLDDITYKHIKLILLPNNTIIISYHPYVYKDGGFCLVIKPKGSPIYSEIILNDEQISELLSDEPAFNLNIPNDGMYEYFLDKFKNFTL